MTQKSFEGRLAKGEAGELIVRAHLERKGWIVYKPHTDGAHAFDILAIFQKKKAIAMDVKSKCRMNFYPATGIDQRHFEEYTAFSEKHRMPFWVVFVDEGLRTVYGNVLSQLEVPRVVDGKQYPLMLGKIRLWPLEAMKRIANLEEGAALQLSSLSQRNYEFQVAA